MISTFTFTNQIAPCIVPFIQGTTHRITPCPHTHTHARTHTHAHQLRVKDVHNTYAYSLQAFVLYICIFYIYLYTIDSSGTERVCVCVCACDQSTPYGPSAYTHDLHQHETPDASQISHRHSQKQWAHSEKNKVHQKAHIRHEADPVHTQHDDQKPCAIVRRKLHGHDRCVASRTPRTQTTQYITHDSASRDTEHTQCGTQIRSALAVGHK